MTSRASMRHIAVAFLALVATIALIGATSARADTGPYLDALDWPPTATYTWARFDAAGIPQVQQGDRYVYNPVTIAEYGLQEWTFYTAGRGNAHLAAAIRAADWLVANQHSDTGTWTYDYDFPVGGMGGVTLRGPWISAMAQGQAMSLLARAWSHTGNQKYLDSADAALAPFRLAVADGGVVADFNLSGRSHPYYEEYPTTPASFTLNGFMFALFGLHDLAEGDPTSDAGDLFGAGMETLKAALPYYDTGGVSAYHLGYLTASQPVHTSLKYHHVHVVELTALDVIDPDTTLELYRDRWAAYTSPTPTTTPKPTGNSRPIAVSLIIAPTAPAAAPRTAARVTIKHRTNRRRWSCKLADHSISRRGHVVCSRARHVLRRKLSRQRVLSTRWRCYGHATVTCRRRDGDWVRVDRFRLR